MLGKKWYQDILKRREQWIESAKHDVQFAKDQIRFWTMYLKDAEKEVKRAEKELQNWKNKDYLNED